MGYLMTQMVLYLVIAAAIGFLSAWLIRSGIANEEKRSFSHQLAANKVHGLATNGVSDWRRN